MDYGPEAPLRWEEHADGSGETSYCRACGSAIYQDEVEEHEPTCEWRSQVRVTHMTDTSRPDTSWIVDEDGRRWDAPLLALRYAVDLPVDLQDEAVRQVRAHVERLGRDADRLATYRLEIQWAIRLRDGVVASAYLPELGSDLPDGETWVHRKVLYGPWLPAQDDAEG